jgi:hypothetical protein
MITYPVPPTAASRAGSGQGRKFPSDPSRCGPLRPPAIRPILPPVPDALLAELERPFLERGDPLPPARAARPLAPGPRKLNYTHEDCIDAILANPAVTQNELAARYGYTASWISLIINSDAFQAALAKRRDEVISPELRATVEERFRALITESQRVLHEKLLQPNCPPALALGVLGTASKALGYGARDANVNINQNTFVVALPPAAATSEDWARGRVIEHSPATVRAPSADPPAGLRLPSAGSSPIGVADSRRLPSGADDAV